MLKKKHKAARTTGRKKPQRGKKLTRGRGWSLSPTKGRERTFRATLLQTFNFGKTRVALFSVPK
jgi:IS5 family transposase